MVTQQRIVLKWILYAVLALFALLVQTCVLGSVTLLGAQFCLLPVAAACVAGREGRDNGALFGLCCGVFWAISGVRYGAIYILAMTVAGALCGLCCELWMRRSLVSSLLLSFGMLLLCEGSVCVYLIATGLLPVRAISSTLLPTCVISLLFVPLLHILATAIAKIGGNYGA
jgi:rod shape-determining protein MreD